MNDEQRHPLTMRAAHWTTFFACAILFGTGVAIYNAHPRFRVGDHFVMLPRVPSWLEINLAPKIVHYVFAAIFILCGVVYLIWGFRNGHFRFLKYKIQQKGAYYTVLFFLAPLIVLSGIPLLPVKFLKPLGYIFYGGAKWWHIGVTLALSAFVLGHVTMVVSTGFAKNMRAITTGDEGAPAPAK